VSLKTDSPFETIRSKIIELFGEERANELLSSDIKDYFMDDPILNDDELK